MSWSTRRNTLASATRRLLGMLPVARYRVEGGSMAPAFAPGERVVVNRLAYRAGRPMPGDLVVVRDPRRPERLLLKRIEREDGAGWRVLGDNATASTDSRTFGPVTRDMIVGKVWFRY